MRRSLYVPGMLSLVFLSPSCLWWLHQQRTNVQLATVQLTFPTESDSNMIYFGAWKRVKDSRERWNALDLDGALEANETGMLRFRDELRDLESREDTTRGVHIHFGGSSTYACVMAAIEICRTTVECYELDDHDLWVIHDCR